MRKKKLIEQNRFLFESLQTAQGQIADLKNQISEMSSKIVALSNEKTKIEDTFTAADNNEQSEKETPVEIKPKTVEKPVVPVLSTDTEYGSKAIGKIVISATKSINTLTVDGNTTHRELVNLILGRTEVAKSDILEIVTGDKSLDEKKRLIDAVITDSFEYFDSVLLQK